MNIAELSLPGLQARLRSGDVMLAFGPLRARVMADDRTFAAAVQRLYGEWEAGSAVDEVADMTLVLKRVSRGRWVWVIDGRETGRTFARDMALAQFEWAMHLALAVAVAPSISIHAAVAVRPDGRAVALVGRSGSGKSTLAAGLNASGWALAADEFLLVDRSGSLVPVPGVITLKGTAIDLIRSRSSDGVFGPVATDPERGPIAHFSSPRTRRDGAGLDLRTIIFPRYTSGEESLIRPIARGEAIIRLGAQSHNLHLVGPAGFEALARLSRRPVYAIRYATLDDAIRMANDLLDQS